MFWKIYVFIRVESIETPTELKTVKEIKRGMATKASNFHIPVIIGAVGKRNMEN